jgi:hypothetical protein
MADAYAIEIISRLSRREAEALALELSELARRHKLKIARCTVTPLAPTGTVQDSRVSSP